MPAASGETRPSVQQSRDGDEDEIKRGSGFAERGTEILVTFLAKLHGRSLRLQVGERAPAGDHSGGVGAGMKHSDARRMTGGKEVGRVGTSEAKKLYDVGAQAEASGRYARPTSSAASLWSRPVNAPSLRPIAAHHLAVPEPLTFDARSHHDVPRRRAAEPSTSGGFTRRLTRMKSPEPQRGPTLPPTVTTALTPGFFSLNAFRATGPTWTSA